MFEDINCDCGDNRSPLPMSRKVMLNGLMNSMFLETVMGVFDNVTEQFSSFKPLPVMMILEKINNRIGYDRNHVGNDYRFKGWMTRKSGQTR